MLREGIAQARRFPTSNETSRDAPPVVRFWDFWDIAGIRWLVRREGPASRRCSGAAIENSGKDRDASRNIPPVGVAASSGAEVSMSSVNRSNDVLSCSRWYVNISSAWIASKRLNTIYCRVIYHTNKTVICKKKVSTGVGWSKHSKYLDNANCDSENMCTGAFGPLNIPKVGIWIELFVVPASSKLIHNVRLFLKLVWIETSTCQWCSSF